MMVNNMVTNQNSTEVVVITASDLNEKYLSCVPWFIDFWLAQKSANNNLVFTPLVLIIADELPIELANYEKYCRVFKSDLPSSFVAQNIRTLFASIIPTDFVVTSDIDMLPMNSKLFDLAFISAKNNPDQNFVVTRDVLPEGQFPICYSFGSPKVWEKITGISLLSDINPKLQELFNTLNSEQYAGRHGGYGWFIDQEFLYESAIAAAATKLIEIKKFRDEQTGHKRLDRIYHRGLIKWLVLPKIRCEEYSDYHVHHPVKNNERYLRTLLEIKRG